jgi:diguanylate cyclase (GGDEF)-like protein
MHDPSADPLWLRWLNRHTQRAGALRLLALLAVMTVGLALGIGELVMLFTGQGERLAVAMAAGATALLFTTLFGAMVLALLLALHRTRSRLSVLATQDDLTGVLNRRHFMLLAEREWARCRRYESDGAVLLIDADHFKRINDRHGHIGGDALLREIVRVAAGSLRQADVLARFGGEALIVLLPQTDPLGALDVAERIREHVAALRLDWQGSSMFTTVSVGVASMGASHTSLDALLLDAEHALGAAKAAGRNCVRAAPIQPRRSGEARPVISK